MRFGKCTWSEDDDGIKYELILVDQTADEARGSFPGLNEPELSNVMYLASSTSALLDALLEELGAAGTLSAAQLETVRTKARKTFSNKVRQLYRATDIDL